VAWGLGLLCALAALLASSGARGIYVQIIASVGTLWGILVGKYFIVWDNIKSMLINQYGESIKDTISIFSAGALDAFLLFFDKIWTAYDILWVALGLYTAIRMTKAVIYEVH
jgi:hypothetical protein